MKTFGLPESQTLVSLQLNADGTPRFDAIRPAGKWAQTDDDAPWNQEGADPESDWSDHFWTPPAVVPLVKLPQPQVSATQKAVPVLIWHEDRVERAWQIVDKTPEEIAEDARKRWPDAEAFVAEFTLPEMAAIGLSTDPTIAALRFLLSSWRSQVISDDPRVQAGMDALVQTGILTEDRRVEILS
jgi:hypothetical protein